MTKKTLIVANDLPGVGKVALASAIPVLNSCQVETLALPTVLLSSHTGGFPQVAIHDTGDFITQALTQWRVLDLQAEALFIGYCRNTKQLEQLLDYHLEQTHPQQLFIDPIMGDNGKLYSGFTKEYVSHMRTLAQHASLLMPNVTEATLLAGVPYPTAPQPPDYYEQLARKVSDIGPKMVLLTGVPHPTEERIGVLAYERATGTVTTAFTTKYPHHFFGTGDLFAALISAFYLHGIPVDKALPIVLDWMNDCMKDTLLSGRSLQYGLAIEEQLHRYSHYFTEKGDSQ